MEQGQQHPDDAPAFSRGHSLTRQLSSALVGLPVGQPEDRHPGHQPLNRGQNSWQANRSRVEENQRLVAAQLLGYSLPLMVSAGVLVISLLMGTLVLYVKGWLVISKFSEKPCDQPLKWWLLTTLLLPLAQCQLNSLIHAHSRIKRLQAILMPAVLGTGAWMVAKCKTCSETNPDLFIYAKTYLVYQTALWVIMIMLSCTFVSFIVWMHRNGLLDTGPGPASAARSGLIDELETVPQDSELFRAGSRADDIECSICQELFDAPFARGGSVIKRMPCCHNYFHGRCLENWLTGYGRTCPICRADLERLCDSSHEPPDLP